MPNLLSLNNYGYIRGGSDAVFLAHDRLFAERGWDTAIMAMQHPKNFPSKWSPYFVDEIEMGRDYSLAQKAKMSAKIIYSREARRKLRALLDVFTPDVAHVHNIYHHISPSVLSLLKERGVPMVMTAHDLKLACPNYKMLNRTGVCERCRGGNYLNVIRHRCLHGSVSLSALVALESTLHRALRSYSGNLNKIVAPSTFMRNKLIEWGWPASMIEVIPNFVAYESMQPQFAPGSYFVYFGRLQMDKGLDTLVHAAADAKVALHVVGTGPDEKAMAHIAAQTGAQVTFHGYQSGTALHTLVREARAVVIPSRLYENAPIAALEAYALGKPVIGSRIGGIPELVREGETGALFDTGDVAALSAILRHYQDAADATLMQMGRAGREMVEHGFSESAYVRRMADLYARVGVRVAAQAMSANITYNMN